MRSLRSCCGTKTQLAAELTPLIDMVFILLIFFMLSSSFLKPVIQLTLPDAETASEVSQDDTYTISITKAGTLYFNQQELNFQTLGLKLDTLVQETKDPTIIFSADQSIPYQNFVKVMDILKARNIQSIALEHDSPQ